MMLWWLMKGCMGQRFCNAVVWIAELKYAATLPCNLSLMLQRSVEI